MPTRFYLFEPDEVARILQDSLGVPGRCEMIPAFRTAPMSLVQGEHTLAGTSTVFAGIRLVIHDQPITPDAEERLRTILNT